MKIEILNGSCGAGAATDLAHTLGAVPDLTVLVGATDDLSITDADATDVEVTNSDGVAAHHASVAAFLWSHSIEAPVDASVSPAQPPGTKYQTISAVLTGNPTVDVIPHALGVLPDLIICHANYDVGTIGNIELSDFSDSSISVVGAAGGAAATFTVVAHHSIQRASPNCLDPSAYYIRASGILTVPWSGGPAGIRTVAHGLGFAPDYVIVSMLGEIGGVAVDPEAVYYNGGAITATNVDLWTAAGADAAVSLFGIRRHSMLVE